MNPSLPFRLPRPLLPFLLLSAAAAPLFAQPAPVELNASNISLQNEVQASIDRGVAWLKTQQKPEGYWSTPDLPAMTAMPLTVFYRNPRRDASSKPDEVMQKGMDFLLKSQQPTGGFYQPGERRYYNYNTAIAVMALLSANNPGLKDQILKGRRFLAGQQNDYDKSGEADNLLDGGFGYGSAPGETVKPSGDLSNTVYVLEALRATQTLSTDNQEPAAKNLDWNAAIGFLERCQNLSKVNKQAWVSDDPANIGGFIYAPTRTMAGEVTLPDGRKTLRSYGSMSYAGLLSYVYADLKKDDPRVQAVYDWLRHNYTVDENPGMGTEGQYYYYQMLAKALTAYGVDEITLADGKSARWREDLAKKLLNTQKTDGYWINDDKARWMEQDPVLVTSYALLALEMIQPKL